MTHMSLQLAVGFITPWFFAAGLLLASIPIIIHILNRRRFKVVNWAAMDYLMRAMKKNRRRLKFEQLLLLATRCLVLALLGLALARPLGCSDNSLANLAGRRSGLHVFVIDNGYSMNYEADRANAKTDLDQAKVIAKTLIGRLSSGGESVAVVTTARQPAENGESPKVEIQPTYDLDAARAAVDRIEPSFAGTDLVGALQKAKQLALGETKSPNRSLYILTNSTKSAWESSAADSLKQTGKELADVFKVGITHFDLGKPSQWNQAILDVRPTDHLVTKTFSNNFVADAIGYGQGPTPQLTWRLDDELLPPGATAVPVDLNVKHVAQPNAQFKTGGPHVLSVSLDSANRLKADDNRWHVVDVVSQLKMLIVEGERNPGALGGSGVFLQMALAPPTSSDGSAPAANNSYVAPEVISDLELGNKVLSDYNVIALCAVGNLQDSTAAALEKFVRQGGTLMLFMGDPVTAENYNATLYKHGLLPGPLVKLMKPDANGNGYHFDFNPKSPNLPPMLQDFHDVDNSGLNTAEIYQYWQMDLAPDARVDRILDYLPADGSKSKGDPAITVSSLGDGRVVFYSTTANANNEWTLFPAKPAYVSLMNAMLLNTANSGERWLNLTVGQSLEIPASYKLTAAPVLKDAAGKEVLIQQVQNSDGQSIYRSQAVTKPGVYWLWTGAGSIPVAVNVPADEADVRYVDGAAIRRALGDIDLKLEGDQPPVETASAQQGKDLGWSVMLIVLGLVGAEAFMAMRFGHHRRASRPVAAAA